MTKRFKHMTCVYCATAGASSTGDHVVCRAFFPEDERDKLPQVPACIPCNNEKSALEHYLAAALPIGDRSSGLKKRMTDHVIARLNKNEKLRRILNDGKRVVADELVHDDVRHEFEEPFDGVKLTALCGKIAQGLAFHHWDIIYPKGFKMMSFFPRKSGREQLDVLFAHGDPVSISKDLGDGIFQYHAVRYIDQTNLTMWRMSPYGAEFQFDFGDTEERVKYVYVVLASTMLVEFETMLNLLAS